MRSEPDHQMVRIDGGDAAAEARAQTVRAGWHRKRWRGLRGRDRGRDGNTAQGGDEDESARETPPMRRPKPHGISSAIPASAFALQRMKESPAVGEPFDR